MTPSAKAHKFILFLLFSSFAVQSVIYSLSMEFALMAGQLISLLIPLLIYLAFTGGGFALRLGLKSFKLRDVIWGIGVTLLLQPFLMLLATAVEGVAGNPMEALVQNLASTPVWITITGLALMPAIVEEVVFRGYLLGSYRKFPLWTAALLNGAVFGMFHMNLYQFSYAMILGVFFSVVTRRCGSVIPAMAMHFINNLISVILLYNLNSRWYMALEEVLKAGTTMGPGIVGGLLAGTLSLGGALMLIRLNDPEGRYREDCQVALEGSLLRTLAYDWPLMILSMVFGVLALAQPIGDLFKNL